MQKALKISGWARLSLGLVIAAAITSPAFAGGGQLDQIVDTYKNGSSAWEPTLRAYAMGLFAALVGIEVGFTGIKLAFKGADLGEWLAEIVNRIMFIGFFSALLTNSATWSRAIVNSFRQAGNAASAAGGGSGGVRPSDIFDAGISMAMTIMKTDTGVGIDAVAQKIGIVVAGIIIAVCFAFIAALLILALCESYLVISAGVLFMGFGGSRWTKDFAVKTITYAVSVGAKLFVMQLIIGLGEAMVKGWAAGFQTGMDQEHVFVMIGSSIVLLAVTKTIPEQVQSLISGVSPNGSGVMAAAAAAVGGAAGGAIAAAAGAGTALGGAARLASEQLKSSDGAPSTGLGRGMALAGGTMKNLASAGAQDVGARLGGRAHHGTMAGRMGDRMNTKADEMGASNKKPSAPAASSPQAAAPGAQAQKPAAGSVSGAGPGSGSAGGSAGGSAPASGGGAPMQSASAAEPEMAMAGGGSEASAGSSAGGSHGGSSAAADTIHSAPASAQSGPSVGGEADDGEGEGVIAAPVSRTVSSAAASAAGSPAGDSASAATVHGAPASSGGSTGSAGSGQQRAGGSSAASSVQGTSAPGGAPAPGSQQASPSAASSGGAEPAAPVAGTIRGAGAAGSDSTASTPAASAGGGGEGRTSATQPTTRAAPSPTPPAPSGRPAVQPPSIGGRLGGQAEPPKAGPGRTIRGAKPTEPNDSDAG